ncbi:MAG TPA: hypothetical protein VE954_06040 [Oligoflexus sp.]|uniref:hypothetical protein n=1 Tax=Oligoflexus sp. TaxID=1971216 RepID=UPI002D740635|nr:hypothetical protein [Oligoflexus sp.]HYX32654.1 hypothetical protein [Oligoflexus sp.]
MNRKTFFAASIYLLSSLVFGADQQTTGVHELLEIGELPTRNVQVVWHLANSFTV